MILLWLPKLINFTISTTVDYLIFTKNFKMSLCVYNIIIYFKKFKYPQIILLNYKKKPGLLFFV